VAGVTEELAAILASLGPAGLGLAIAAVPTAVAIAIYVTRMALQAKIERLEGELAQSRARHAEELKKLQEQHAELEQRHRAVLQTGAVISNTLQQIEADVAEIAQQVDATDYSVLVPAPTLNPGDQPDQLVFLCASGPQAATLRRIRVPIARSLAGQVLRSGRPSITQKPGSEEAFSARTDQVSNFRTEEVLSLPLLHRAGCIGVLQLLNKRGAEPFDSGDIERAQNWSGPLARRVAEFVEDPRRLAALGHTPRQNRVQATVLFTDISNFAQLFNELDSSVVTDLVNQYFQELCSIGLHHGGVIEQFLGDGFMMTFNVNQTLDRHASVAVRAAWEMLQAFRALRERWVTLGYAGTARCFLRIGVECGPVTKTEVGHLQHRKLTVMGAVVNVAAHLCDAGPRNRDVVLVGDGIQATLDPGVELRFCERAPRSQEPRHEVVSAG
jgi:class 3 adenylate cyclase